MLHVCLMHLDHQTKSVQETTKQQQEVRIEERALDYPDVEKLAFKRVRLIWTLDQGKVSNVKG